LNIHGACWAGPLVRCDKHFWPNIDLGCTKTLFQCHEIGSLLIKLIPTPFRAAMKPKSTNSSKQRMQEHLSAFEIFCCYNRQRLLRQNTMSYDDCVMSSQSPFSPRSPRSSPRFNYNTELSKEYVQNILNEVPPHDSSPMNSDKLTERMCHEWKLSDDTMKKIFKQLAVERRYIRNEPIQEDQAPQSNLFHTAEASLVLCPIIHCPSRPTKMRKLSCQDQDANSPDADMDMDASKRHTLAGISSLTGNEDNVSFDELRRFLSALDWDQDDLDARL